MAASKHPDGVQQAPTCPTSLQYCTGPGCPDCTTQHWEGLGSDPQCPRPNNELGDSAEEIKLDINPPSLPEAAALCPRHQQRLQLFCETDLQPICVVCDRSKEIRDHTVMPAEEAAQEHKENVKNQTGKILGTFEQLQQFLETEKKKLLIQVENEHELNMKNIQEKESNLDNPQRTHTGLIREMEATCKKQEVELLEDVQSILNRCDNVKAQKPVDDVKVAQTLQRGEHAHLQDKLMELKETFPGLVEFWAQRKIYEREVTLDPGTANGWLVLSQNGRSVRLRDREPDLPDTHKRDDDVPCILGRERLSSGSHYWEVEVGDKTRWDLGVCDESASRIGDTPRTPRNGYWVVWLRDGGKYSACTSPLTPLSPCVPPRVVGLFLDYEGGRFSVYNAEDRSLLYTFSGVSFPRNLRPYFCPCNINGGENAGALRVLPVTGRELERPRM